MACFADNDELQATARSSSLRLLQINLQMIIHKGRSLCQTAKVTLGQRQPPVVRFGSHYRQQATLPQISFLWKNC